MAFELLVLTLAFVLGSHGGTKQPTPGQSHRGPSQPDDWRRVCENIFFSIFLRIRLTSYLHNSPRIVTVTSGETRI